MFLGTCCTHRWLILRTANTETMPEKCNVSIESRTTQSQWKNDCFNTFFSLCSCSSFSNQRLVCSMLMQSDFLLMQINYASRWSARKKINKKKSLKTSWRSWCASFNSTTKPVSTNFGLKNTHWNFHSHNDVWWNRKRLIKWSCFSCISNR